MKTTQRDDASVRGETRSPGSAARGHMLIRPLSAPEDSASTLPSAVGCHRYVLGVFGAPTEADGAIAALAAGPARACDVLLVSDTPVGRKTAAAITAGARVTIQHIDATASLTRRFSEALRNTRSFSALWDSMRTQSDRSDVSGPPGMQRQFQHLVHQVAKGAAVVIVSAPDPEQQISASRTLLDAKCETLLTHEVLKSSGDTISESEHDEGCCQNCTSKSCGRFDKP